MDTGTACKSKMTVSKIRTEDDHFSLSSTSGVGIETAMVDFHVDISSSSAGAIHVKRHSFRVLGDECETWIGADCISFGRSSVHSIVVERTTCSSAGTSVP
jgi:hypothetical protein